MLTPAEKKEREKKEGRQKNLLEAEKTETYISVNIYKKEEKEPTSQFRNLTIKKKDFGCCAWWFHGWFKYINI